MINLKTKGKTNICRAKNKKRKYGATDVFTFG